MMTQAILLEDVDKLGQRGDPIDVSPGYLRNYLIPRKLATPATTGALEEAQRRRVATEKAEKARAEREEQAASLLSKTVLTIHQRAGEDGKLFGSVGAKEIVDAISEARDLRIDRRKVRLEQPLREIGTHMVEIELADGTTASVKTIITEER
jgi:large subunit ribosomal protein L9